MQRHARGVEDEIERDVRLERTGDLQREDRERGRLHRRFARGDRLQRKRVPLMRERRALVAEDEIRFVEAPMRGERVGRERERRGERIARRRHVARAREPIARFDRDACGVLARDRIARLHPCDLREDRGGLHDVAAVA